MLAKQPMNSRRWGVSLLVVGLLFGQILSASAQSNVYLPQLTQDSPPNQEGPPSDELRLGPEEIPQAELRQPTQAAEVTPMHDEGIGEGEAEQPPVSAAAYDITGNWRVSGRIGIGTDIPQHRLSIINGPTWTSNGWRGAIELTNASAIGWRANAGGWRFGIGQTSGGLYFFRTTSNPGTAASAAEYKMVIRDTGWVGIGTTSPASQLDVRGTSRTQILRITGGGDLAEPFDIAGADEVEPGMVVAIDPDHPGQLRIADKAYDRTVAGVVSGAGGIQPGLVLEQEGTLAAGEHPVALTGRVYVWADAAEGAIVPGDLLTTSDTPGHAMKVADYVQAQGAILGKAMTALDEGTGLVLVLVSLQ